MALKREDLTEQWQLSLWDDVLEKRTPGWIQDHLADFVDPRHQRFLLDVIAQREQERKQQREEKEDAQKKTQRSGIRAHWAMVVLTAVNLALVAYTVFGLRSGVREELARLEGRIGTLETTTDSGFVWVRQEFKSELQDAWDLQYSFWHGQMTKVEERVADLEFAGHLDSLQQARLRETVNVMVEAYLGVKR